MAGVAKRAEPAAWLVLVGERMRDGSVLATAEGSGDAVNSQNERRDGMTHAALVTRCAGLEAELQGMREKAAALDADLDEIDRAASRYLIRSGFPRKQNILNALRCLYLNYRKFYNQWEQPERFWQGRAVRAERHLCKLRFWYGRSKILRRELQARVQRLEADNVRLRAALVECALPCEALVMSEDASELKLIAPEITEQMRVACKMAREALSCSGERRRRDEAE